MNKAIRHALVLFSLLSVAAGGSVYDTPPAPPTATTTTSTAAPLPGAYLASYHRRYAGGEAPHACRADDRTNAVRGNGNDGADGEEPQEEDGEDGGDGGRPKSSPGVHEIFLLPHSHCDVGWEWTISAYFNNTVRHILDSVTADLGTHSSHRFIWSETKWIELWWPSQNDTTRATFKVRE